MKVEVPGVGDGLDVGEGVGVGVGDGGGAGGVPPSVNACRTPSLVLTYTAPLATAGTPTGWSTDPDGTSDILQSGGQVDPPHPAAFHASDRPPSMPAETSP